MTRQVLAVCRSRKKKRAEAAAVLDRYFWRVGDRTWRGYASNACLERVSKDLKRAASRNLAVSLFELRRGHDSMAPLFVVGRKAAFSEDGLCAIRTARDHGAAGKTTDAEILFRAVLDLAAAFHDVGKASIMFQDKLRRAAREATPIADPVRHEVISAFAFDALLGPCGSDAAALERLRGADAAAFEAAYEAAADTAWTLYRRVQVAPEDGTELRFDNLAPGDLADDRPWSLRAAVLALILSHHRLPDIDHGYDVFRSGDLISRHADDGVAKEHFRRAAGTPPWGDAGWQSALMRILDRIATVAEPSADGVGGADGADGADGAAGSAGLDAALAGLPDPAFFGRTALMLADQHGSGDKQPLGAESADGVLLANTHRETGAPMDDLATHTRRVMKSVRSTARLVAHDAARLPGLPIGRCPEAVRTPVQAQGRFAWQQAAASAAARVSAMRPGGFFGCLLAGTGTGKTRGAPTVLAAATFNDPDPARQTLRFALGLGLRTLARQSGADYVADLGFAPSDVATLVGGPDIDTSRDGIDADSRSGGAAGSEDRLADLAGVEVHPAEAEAPRDGAETPEWIAGLGHNSDEDLPHILGEIIGSDRGVGGASEKARALHRLIATPILAATVDHFMPAADARRGGHLVQALRVMSSDLILDEVDLYEPEDLAAIGRLVYLAGASGRRVIVMSASMPADVAERLHAAYRAGWAHHARTAGAPEHVNVLLCGDTEASVVSNESDAPFADLYAAVRTETERALAAAPALRKSEILPDATTITDIAQTVSDAADRMHRAHAVDVDGLRVSVGLVRMTRIDHLQRLAMKVPHLLPRPNQGADALPSCRDALPSGVGAPSSGTDAMTAGVSTSPRSEDADKVSRAFIVLHSRMPMAQRLHIERILKRALTRKGKDPDAEISWLIDKLGLRDRVAAEGTRSLSIVVLSSPVIETGNDIDFDWALIDPSSLRAILQTSGRVNRHRCLPVSTPNIALLPRPLVSVLDEGGLVSRPGVETRPATETGVRELKLEGGRSLHGELLDPAALDTIDARLCLDPARGGPWAAAEAEMRARFAGGFPCLSVFLRRGAARLAADYGRRRRFRRSEDRTVPLLPLYRMGEVEEWGFRDRSGRLSVRVAQPDLAPDDTILATPALDELLAVYARGEGDRVEGSLPLGMRDMETPPVQLDPRLGVVRASTRARMAEE